jgi:hypothetical protein
MKSQKKEKEEEVLKKDNNKSLFNKCQEYSKINVEKDIEAKEKLLKKLNKEVENNESELKDKKEKITALIGSLDILKEFVKIA